MVHSPVRPSPRSGAPSSPAFDICIRGGGIVGHTLALLLARDRLRIALYTPKALPGAAPRPEDVRAYALNGASRELLQSLRVWPCLLYTSPSPRD